MIARRGFLSGILAFSVAPAVVRADSLMKIIVPQQALVVPPPFETYGVNNLCEEMWRATEDERLYINAFVDRDAHQRLGEAMAASLYVSANREGFMRKYLRLTEEQNKKLKTKVIRVNRKVGIITVV